MGVSMICRIYRYALKVVHRFQIAIDHFQSLLIEVDRKISL